MRYLSVDTNNNEHRQNQLANIGEPQPEDRKVISSYKSFVLLVDIVLAFVDFRSRGTIKVTG